VTSPNWFDRTSTLDRLEQDTFDVVIIGGGITGAGCALDAASRGLRTALVEAGDFATGTSSKSSKLVHGGLRYLQNGEIRLVYEALHERQRLLRNAPHLVRLMPFLLPVLTGKDSPVPRKLARALGIAMWAYDLTGGFRIGKFHERLDATKALTHMPTLPVDRLASAYLYHDAQADDARLTLTIARTAAVDHGAAVTNRTRVVGIDKDASGRVSGVRIEAAGLGGEPARSLTVRAAAVVNATGVWADDLRALDEGVHPDSIRPAKGIHITVPWAKVRNDIAVVVPVPGDKRSVFVVPWPNAQGVPTYTYVGTTDTDYDGPLDDPQCTADDVAYLLKAINAAVTTEITEADVLGTWAGLRPLVKAKGDGRTADLSRRHSVQASPSGVVTVTGGKLTTYREMAADTIDEIVRLSSDSLADRVAKRSRTAKLPLRGAVDYADVRAGGPGGAPVDAGVVAHLADRYGSDARTLLAMLEADPALAEPLVAGAPYLEVEAVYAARYEMATSVDDVLSRRTRARLLARDASADAAGRTAQLIGPVLGLSAQQQADQVAAYRAAIDEERRTPALPETALATALGA